MSPQQPFCSSRELARVVMFDEQGQHPQKCPPASTLSSDCTPSWQRVQADFLNWKISDPVCFVLFFSKHFLLFALYKLQFFRNKSFFKEGSLQWSRRKVPGHLASFPFLSSLVISLWILVPPNMEMMLPHKTCETMARQAKSQSIAPRESSILSVEFGIQIMCSVLCWILRLKCNVDLTKFYT